MTASEILTQVKSDLDQQGSTGAFSDAQLLVILNEGYTDFCRYTEVRGKTSTTTVAALDHTVSLPSDHLETRQIRWSYNRHLYPKSERVLDYGQRDWVFEVGTPESTCYYNYNKLRLKPITDSAGTVTFKYAYIPSSLTTSDSPDIPAHFQSCLVNFVNAICFLTLKEKENAGRHWGIYLKAREKAKTQFRDVQRTPDTMISSHPVDIYNYQLWDEGARTK